MSFFCCGSKKPKKDQKTSYSVDKQVSQPELPLKIIQKPPLPSSSLNTSINRKNDTDSIQQSTQNTYVQQTPEYSIQSSRISQRTTTPCEDIYEKISSLLKLKDDGQFNESVQQEKIFITKLINLSDKEEYMLDTKWAFAYTEYLSKASRKMEKIDNRLLLADQQCTLDLNFVISIQDKSILRRGIKKEEDYVFLNEYAWNFVRALYGGGPQLKFENIKKQSSCETPQTNSIKVRDLIYAQVTSSNHSQTASIKSQISIVDSLLIDQDGKPRQDLSNRPPKPKTNNTKLTPIDQEAQSAKINRFAAREKSMDVRVTVQEYRQQELEAEQKKEASQDKINVERNERKNSHKEEQQEQESYTIREQNDIRGLDYLQSRQLQINSSTKQDQLPLIKPMIRAISVQPQIVNKQAPKLWDMQSSELPLVGLRNQRFFCFMNSALQCLMSIQQLNFFYLNGQSKIFKGSKSRKYTPVYEDFLNAVQNKSKGNIPVFDASGLQRLTDSVFSQYEQHDSHEFLLHILSELQEEVHVKSKSPESKTSQDTLNVQFFSHNNPIDQVFAGLITSSVSCAKCKQCTQQFDPIFDLSVPMKSNMMTETSLFDCLKLYFKEEEIDDTWKCELCNKISKPVKRQLKMSYAPNVLIIHMKRFSIFPRKEKIKSDLNYPEELDMKSFSTPECQDMKYNLKSIIVHSGSINGGHYYAFTKRKNTWYCFNDDMVEKVSEQEALKQKQAYVLFYEKVRK